MEKKYIIENPGTSGRVGRYPWWELESQEVTLRITCPSAKAAQQSAYKYAKMAGWKISTKLINTREIIVGRNDKPSYRLVEPAPEAPGVV